MFASWCILSAIDALLDPLLSFINCSYSLSAVQRYSLAAFCGLSWKVSISSVAERTLLSFKISIFSRAQDVRRNIARKNKVRICFTKLSIMVNKGHITAYLSAAFQPEVLRHPDREINRGFKKLSLHLP